MQTLIPHSAAQLPTESQRPWLASYRVCLVIGLLAIAALVWVGAAQAREHVRLQADRASLTARAPAPVKAFVWTVNGHRVARTAATGHGRVRSARLWLHRLPNGRDRVKVWVAGHPNDYGGLVIHLRRWHGPPNAGGTGTSAPGSAANAGGTGTSAQGSAANASTPSRAGSWFSSFASGTFSDWSTWTQPQGGTYGVTTPAAAGIPAPPSGSNEIAHFQVTGAELAAGHIQSKLYKGWDVYNAHRIDEAGRPFARMTNRGAGIYSAWYYLPSDYSMTATGPVDIFQFKEDYSVDGVTFNGFGSDVQSDLNIFSAAGLHGYFGGTYNFGLRADYPLLAVSLWHTPTVTPRPGHQHQAIPAPLGRWFNVTAKLYPGDRVEYYVDGKLLDTWYNDEYPVGVRYPAPGSGPPVAMGWTFGVGHYGVNVGELSVADAAYTPFN